MSKLARIAADVLISRAAWGGSQNFLGARWVEWMVDNAPRPARERIALRFISLSPHYFYDRDLRRGGREEPAVPAVARGPADRARTAARGTGPRFRLRPRLPGGGGGPMAGQVHAVDISRGVLACARALNGLPNITYQTPGQFRAAADRVDVAYSFAVVQHLRTEALAAVVALLAEAMRPGGLLMLHFAVAGEGPVQDRGGMAGGRLADGSGQAPLRAQLLRPNGGRVGGPGNARGVRRRGARPLPGPSRFPVTTYRTSTCSPRGA